MATNNAINLKSSGIASYDGAGTFSALANPLTVPNGGTGVASNTAYAVLCGGTTSTAAIQSIAGVGTATHVLTSNGAGALPTFQAASVGSSLGYVYNIKSTSQNPSDSQTYYITSTQAWTTTSTNVTYRFYIPKAGTITKVYGDMGVILVLGSTENSTLSIRLNDTTDTDITTTLKFSTANNLFNNTGLSIAVVAGDYFTIKIVCPAWATNPTNCQLSMAVYIA